MTTDLTFSNLDLISVGVATAAIGIIGFVVFFNARKSATARSFLLFSLVSVFWSVVNYLQYQTHEPNASFWILRTVLFLGVWHSFSFFQFCFIFPEKEKRFPGWYRSAFLPLVVIASLATFTPLVFESIAQVSITGDLMKVNNGPAIPFVAFLILFSVVGGIWSLVRKMIKATGPARQQLTFVFIGLLITFALLMTFNFILPAFFSITNFIPLGAVFLLPFAAFTFYSISRHHLMDVRMVSTEIMAFALSVATLLEVVASESLPAIILRSGIFVLVLVFSILLIKSVRKEIEQREELERLYRQLEDQNRQLDELSHFKSELLSLASHQIRSPLAAMKGFTSLIMDGTYGPVEPKVKEAIGKVQHSADELIGLINTLLDLRKVEEGKMEYQFTKTDLVKLTGEVIGLLRPLAETKKLELTFTPPNHEVWVNADAEKLKQVIQNLIDNAIKYTPSGFVRVKLDENSPVSATLTVSDSGLGVSATLVPHLFEEFIRDERVKKEIRGTGLGLYIARRIAEAHGGSVWAESAGEGEGSSFCMRMPLMK